MSEQFLHGAEVLEMPGGPRPVRTVKSSVIGIVGTAPDADATAFPLNTPVLVAGSRSESAKLDTTGDSKGTLPAAMDGVFDQCGAMLVVIRVDEGADEAATLTNIIGGTNADGTYHGVHGLLTAESVVKVVPRILCAPGFTHQMPEDPDNAGVKLANPVASELVGISEQLKATIIADGPASNRVDAIAYRESFGTDRIFIVDPWVKVFKDGAVKSEPASARIAGLMAKIDNELGFWWSPSNQEINGIIGTSRPIPFTFGDINCEANHLNENEVATIVHSDGYRLWGNRTCSSDPKFAFLSVRRTADIINDSLLRAHKWAVDRNISKTYIEDVTESVNNYLRHLKKIGAILGGHCWADEELNSPDQIEQGKVYFDFDFTPPYPAEHITFRSHLVNDYIKEIFK
ncbi:MAG: phage tail sheath C-terminal domain-containing protein [Desulfovibrio sp.]